MPPKPAKQPAPRSRPRPDWEPPYPAHSSRFGSNVRQPVIAYFGCQSAEVDSGLQAVDALREHVKRGTRPDYCDRSHYKDGQGFFNEVLIGYWLDEARYDAWLADSGFVTWLNHPDRLIGSAEFGTKPSASPWNGWKPSPVNRSTALPARRPMWKAWFANTPIRIHAPQNRNRIRRSAGKFTSRFAEPCQARDEGRTHTNRATGQLGGDRIGTGLVEMRWRGTGDVSRRCSPQIDRRHELSSRSPRGNRLLRLQVHGRAGRGRRKARGLVRLGDVSLTATS